MTPIRTSLLLVTLALLAGCGESPRLQGSSGPSGGTIVVTASAVASPASAGGSATPPPSTSPPMTGHAGVEAEDGQSEGDEDRDRGRPEEPRTSPEELRQRAKAGERYSLAPSAG